MRAEFFIVFERTLRSDLWSSLGIKWKVISCMQSSESDWISCRDFFIKTALFPTFFIQFLIFFIDKNEIPQINVWSFQQRMHFRWDLRVETFKFLIEWPRLMLWEKIHSTLLKYFLWIHSILAFQVEEFKARFNIQIGFWLKYAFFY